MANKKIQLVFLERKMTQERKLPDFSDRDSNIRHQTYSPVRKLDGVPHELFAAIRGDLAKKKPSWVGAAAEAMVKRTTIDWKEWKSR